jgi:predicted amidophosphoribosyltransferase
MNMIECSDCGVEVPVDEVVYCSNCGAPLCGDCGTMGFCSKCEEIWQAEDDFEIEEMEETEEAY